MNHELTSVPHCLSPSICTAARRRQRRFAGLALVGMTLGLLAIPSNAPAQPPSVRTGDVVPRDVREIYDRGLQYLASTQTENGNWTGGQDGPGTTGLALMVFLASGEDPNYGLYSNHVRRALRIDWTGWPKWIGTW